MTTETIDGLRRLLARTNDENDIQFLRAILRTVDAFDSDGPEEEKLRCSACKCWWPPAKLDKGICPNCLLDALYLRQTQWRRNQYIETEIKLKGELQNERNRNQR